MITKVKVLVVFGLLCALLALPGEAFAAKKSTTLKDAKGKEFFLAVNVWAEKPEEIFTTNFHKGPILPVNTKVTIVSANAKGFTFTDQDGISYTIAIARKHTTSPADVIFNRYFSSGKVNLGRFNSEERKNIESGTITEGMSKDAVLVAYGYPPEHVTPSLESNQWKYWRDRFRNFFVFFNKEGKVIRTGDE